LSRLRPREIIGDVPSALRTRFPQTAYTAFSLDAAASVQAELGALYHPGLDALAGRAAACAYAYARATQPSQEGRLPVVRIAAYRTSEFLVLDEATCTNLELFQTLMERKKQGSLLGVLDQTRTSPGGRLLRSWLAYPLRDLEKICRRQDSIELLISQP